MIVDVRRLNRAGFLILALCMAIILAPAPAFGQGNGRLFVFAASSLTDAFLAIEEAFETQFPDTDVILNIAGSSTLATQIIQGAPADVFASANMIQMQRVQSEGLLDDNTIRSFARNRLILITSLENNAGITTLADLTGNLSLVIASRGVPIREYTEQVLNNLNTRFGETYSSDVLANVVSEEDNVRRITLKITLGEADAGFVYASDITTDIQERVNLIEIPFAYNRIASYPIAPLTDADNRHDAQAFIDFVLSSEGQSLLENYGFMSAYIPKTPLYFGN